MNDTINWRWLFSLYYQDGTKDYDIDLEVMDRKLYELAKNPDPAMKTAEISTVQGYDVKDFNNVFIIEIVKVDSEGNIL